MKSLAIEFGLTPSSRASLAKPKGDDKLKPMLKSGLVIGYEIRRKTHAICL